MDGKYFSLQLIFLIGAALVLSLSMFVWLSFLSPSSRIPFMPGGNQVACTLEAKICPDGTAVGRVGLKCEFAPCPIIQKTAFGTAVIFDIEKRVTFTDGLTMTLKEINDSRCKPEVICVWAGELSGLFTITGGKMAGIPQELRLGTANNAKVAKSGYLFHLVQAAESTATVVVTEAETPTGSCYVSGCSSEICSDQKDIVSICLFKPEYECYKGAACERQTSGQCGWTQTPELIRCLVESSKRLQ